MGPLHARALGVEERRPREKRARLRGRAAHRSEAREELHQPESRPHRAEALRRGDREVDERKRDRQRVDRSASVDGPCLHRPEQDRRGGRRVSSRDRAQRAGRLVAEQSRPVVPGTGLHRGRGAVPGEGHRGQPERAGVPQQPRHGARAHGPLPAARPKPTRARWPPTPATRRRGRTWRASPRSRAVRRSRSISAALARGVDEERKVARDETK